MNPFNGMLGKLVHQSLAKLVSIGRERAGTAAVEFAVALPILLALTVGAAELSQVYIAERKLLRATNVVGELLVREPVADRAEIERLFNGAEEILGADLTQGLEIVVTAVERVSSAGPPGQVDPTKGQGNNGNQQGNNGNQNAGANGNASQNNGRGRGRAQADSDDKMLVVWSQARGTAADAEGQQFLFDSGLMPVGDFYIVVTIKSQYTGSLTQILVDDVVLDEQYEFEPRDSDRIDVI